MKVWIITDGTLDEMQIVGVYADHDKAEAKYNEMKRWRDAHREEFVGYEVGFEEAEVIE